MNADNRSKTEVLEEFQIEVQKIIFFKNGFVVMSTNRRNEHGEPVVAVGNMVQAPNPGELFTLRGKWVEDPKFGRQFRFSEFEQRRPTEHQGIQRFLCAKIPFIGPALAARITEKFGKDTFDILDADPERLKEIPGIGSHYEKIVHEWQEQQTGREHIAWLLEHRLTPYQASRIYEKYGNHIQEVLTENPYCLMEMEGFGFLRSDEIAMKLGHPKSSPYRARAAVLYLLENAESEGHVFLPSSSILQRAAIQKFMISSDAMQKAIQEHVDRKAIIKTPEGECYRASMYYAEQEVAEKLLEFGNEETSYPELDSYFSNPICIDDITLNEDQVRAVRTALSHQFCVITGGPGTGKTTIIQAIIRCYEQFAYNPIIELAAPTGKAAQRMAEKTQHPARTIHRLLEYKPLNGYSWVFTRDAGNPLTCDMLIVDEMSMVDINLLHALLEALDPRHTRLILVGDIDQLPSVGPGQCLRDVIESERFAVARLTEIMRQKKDSLIVQNAHRVNRGEDLIWNDEADRELDFFFVEEEGKFRLPDIIVRLVSEVFPTTFGFDAVRDIQVLCPMKKGPAGTVYLNEQLRQALNPLRPGEKEFKDFRMRDKVIQVKNNYKKGVFNGDMGEVIEVEDKYLAAYYEHLEMPVFYSQDDIHEIQMAYALTVHKSQGSEYPCVVIPVHRTNYIMLQRNLAYTALTRAQQKVCLVGTRDAVGIAIANDKVQQRYTHLKDLLMSEN